MRNFIYNKSDILVALAIILVALVIIFFRVNALMDFSGRGTAEVPVSTAGVTTEEENTGEGEETGPVPTSFKVESGATSDSIAEDLVSAGFISSADEFLAEVSAQGAETKLKTGTFVIPVGSNVSDIVKILVR